jgi:hypothetical protein
MDTDALSCRLCGATFTTGLAAIERGFGCLGSTPVAGSYPEHGALGPEPVEVA